MEITTRTTISEIREMAEEDGYLNLSRETASAIKRACLNGSCAWTREKIVTTDDSRLSIFPGRRYSAGDNTDHGTLYFSHENDAMAYYDRHLRPRRNAGNKYYSFVRANFGDRVSLLEGRA